MNRKAGMGPTGLSGETTASWKFSVSIICSQMEVGFCIQLNRKAGLLYEDKKRAVIIKYS